MDQPPEFEPLKVRCTDTKCEADLHCFSPNRRKKNWRKEYDGGCQTCGRQLVDWDRVKARDLSDVEGTFRELEHELIRHVFFHAELDPKARAEADRLGIAGLKAQAREHLHKRIGRPDEIFRDGTQTPKKDSALNFAQHATATCCRKCLEYWYGIPRDRDLTAEELDYFEGLVCAYLDRRADELSGPRSAAEQPA